MWRPRRDVDWYETMTDEMAEIGARIQRLRKERDLTQTELAEALDLGDDSIVSKIENGTRGLAATELADLCALFGLRSDQILFGTPEEKPVGTMLRAEGDEDVERVVARVEEAFADLRYVRALVES
jgi:transcriptional regulator with XRE-family HTH domain